MPPEKNSQPTTDNQPQNPASPLKQIRTFQGDVANAITRQKTSLFSIQQQESLKRGYIPENLEAEEAERIKRREFLRLLIGSFLLIALGSVGAWFTYQEFIRKSAPPEIVAPKSRLILVNSSRQIDFNGATRDAFFAKVFESSSEVPNNEIQHLVLKVGSGTTTTEVASSAFLAALQSSAPFSLLRAFDPIFMLGTVGKKPFIIFQISSFENAFAGMLSWEKSLAQDLGPIFATKEELNVIAPQSVFRDIISRNKDVRALLTGTSTEPVILYSFFDNKKLIITHDLETLRVVVDKLTQGLLSR